MKVLTQRSRSRIKITFLVVLLKNLFAWMIGLVGQLLLLEVKMLLMNLLKQFLMGMVLQKSNEKTL